MIYLSGHISQSVRALPAPHRLGLLVTFGRPNRNRGSLPWAIDNACFTQGNAFDLPAYLAWLYRTTPADCLFATAPDVVGNARATWERSRHVLPRIQWLGFLAAYVAQDGIEDLDVPWDAFDVLFIGGTTAWKESCVVLDLCLEAKQHGKWVHMGRVNSERRCRWAMVCGCDSVDGTYLAFGPDTNLPKLCGWLERIHQQSDFFAVA